MPQVEIGIGGRTFEVACQEGEEHFLRAAAAMLDTEAQTLSVQIGRMPESRMLLMAGLLLADRTAALEDKVREAESKSAELAAKIETLESHRPEAERIEVPVIPTAVTDSLAELAARAEALAQDIEEKASPAS